MRMIVLAAALALAAGAARADPVEGEWLNQARTGKIHIAACPGKADRLCGAISSMTDRTKTLDANNPDPALRSRSLIGLQVLRDFRRAEPGRWTNGRIYDPKSGKTYDSRLSFGANGSLKVEGCIAILCQAQTWTRD